MLVLARIIDIYTLILFVTVLLSWFPIPQDHPAVRVLRAITEPVLAPVRRVLPAMGGMDFSPLVVLILLQFLKSALFR